MDTIEYTDIVVLGGGSAGTAAAIAASQQGLKVTLIERNSFLGGKATAAEVGTVCGLYHFSKNENSEYIVKGFVKDFAETLQQRSGSNPLHNAEGLHYLPYNIDAFKSLCLQLLSDHDVRIFFNAVLKNVVTENKKMVSVSVIAGGKPVTIFFKSLIDCSGDSVISSAADLRHERTNLVRFMVGSGGLVGTFVVIFVAMSIMAARRAGSL